ncbi:MAG TPA: NAD(P)-dependent oxidoreductase [Candidatus Caldiarchaeum subterraneum]|uniref:NAD(P)-dependent oxidoreductase n=1 Tax=Caldiarchaeum subterraneum TaxID=311458 RepID=A0A832ZUU6_CALS0|nr:NAD(P)-dependent oxidoreductase [Candidatus Caldarchaeum subterraneum]
MSVILITGGCGFLGAWLSRALIEQEHDVILLDLNITRLTADIRGRVRVFKGDVTDSRKLDEVIRRTKPDYVVHYAALLSTAVEKDPKKGYKVNIAPVWNIFEKAVKHDVEGIVFASSVAAYGYAGEKVVRESDYIPPLTLYGVSKLHTETLGIWFYKRYGIEFAALRYASVIGPGRRDGGASAYTTLAIQKPAQGEEYAVNAPPESRIPIVYVKDAVDATIFIMSRMKRLRYEDRVINVAGPQPSPSAAEIVEAVNQVIQDVKVSFQVSDKVAEIIKSWPREVDTSKLRNLGWSPKYGKLTTLVRDFIDEVRKNPKVFSV